MRFIVSIVYVGLTLSVIISDVRVAFHLLLLILPKQFGLIILLVIDLLEDW